MQVSNRGVQPVCKGEAELRDTRHEAARNLMMVQRSQSCNGITASFVQRVESTRLRLNKMNDGVTKSFFAHLIPAKGVDFPSCEKVVKMLVYNLDKLGHRVVFRCDKKSSIFALLTEVKLASTGVVVHETSAEGEGDPQSKSAAESSVNVVKGLVRSIKLAEKKSAPGVQVPTDHDLLTWLVPHTAGFRLVETARQLAKGV